MVALYDISALLALLDEEHEKHDPVSSWFVDNTDRGWSSCPLTQNGYLRIRSQPAYPHSLSIVKAHEQLLDATSTPYHQFISDDISILDESLVNASQMLGYRQLTDVYLLALAVAHNALLVTLDTHIPSSAVRGATDDHLVVI